MTTIVEFGGFAATFSISTLSTSAVTYFEVDGAAGSDDVSPGSEPHAEVINMTINNAAVISPILAVFTVCFFLAMPAFSRPEYP